MNMQALGIRRETPLYVYAILPARSNGNDNFCPETVGDGLGAIASGPFAAVVGDGPGTESLIQGREELARLLLEHQRTLEQIMRSVPLLPVKFGTFAPDERSVRAILDRGAAVFETAFGRLEGCVQVEVFVKWDVQTVFAEIAKEEAIAALKEKLGLGVCATGQASRANLGRLVMESLERRRSVLAASLSASLQAVAVDAIAYQVTADQAVLHLVLLMKSGQMEALDTCLEALDEAHGGRLTFRCVGPLAPYNFGTVEIEFVDAPVLRQALRLLEIGSTANAAEVRAAYHHRAKSVHPDTANASVKGCADMVALKEAYRIASLHAENRRQADTEAVLSESDPNFSDRSVFVSVRRQDQVFDAAV